MDAVILPKATVHKEKALEAQEIERNIDLEMLQNSQVNLINLKTESLS